ncbi:hypothetical protein C8R27_1673 [Nitrosomonas ureae]|uniref:virulence factor TspB C-terminal domain-related protein n=1 Tax=Nitrosomonas ureae TaxID=44577 RepID=UPI000D756C15|nr:virulence factor TspB C-terminal domain-related protein [Nitrosomonas ureae]PXX06163.1 hypothetical protein C8R27_1673 [Nitrosomonas ureae]
MDTFKLKLIAVAVLIALSQPVYAELFDMSQHSGIIKDSTGNFYKVNSAGTVSAIRTGSNLSLVEKVPIPTSKGFFSVDLSRNAPINVSRVGKSVRGLSLLGGPLGLSVTALSLVCELSSLCNSAGEWVLRNVDFGGTASGSYPSCEEAIGVAAGSNWAACTQINNTIPNGHWFRSPAVPDPSAGCTGHGGTAWTYTGIIYTCTNAPSVDVPATEADWNAKESKLNDVRLVDELLDKAAPVPVGSPSLTSPVTVNTGSSTKTIKDAGGNVTGTETTTSEATISEPTSGENPSGSPTIIKITENHTTNNYNTNNELTGSTTTTTGGTAQPQQQSQSFEIEIDNIEATPLQERAVPFPFETDSWGSGSCPSDRTVNYHYGTLNLTFEPACQFAEGIKPIVLILAGFIAMFIIMGGTKDAN